MDQSHKPSEPKRGGPRADALWLEPLNDRALPQVSLAPPRQIRIGRREEHDVTLPAQIVSRDHAVLRPRTDGDEVTWCLVDTSSRHGTFLNGARLEPEQEYPLRPDDVIHVGSIAFRVVGKRPEPAGAATLVHTIDDSGDTASRVSKVAAEIRSKLAFDRLQLLMRCARELSRCRDETDLADFLIDAATNGTGFPNAALLRKAPGGAEIELVRSSGELTDATGQHFSRTLLQEAEAGEAVRLERSLMSSQYGHSIEQLGIDQALCVPLRMGPTVSAYLYLDSRAGTHDSRAILPDGLEFAVALGEMASLALANLRRLELERRQAMLDAELKAAAAIQQMLLPPTPLVVEPFTSTGICVPGRVMSGDFFDVYQAGGRLVVLVGDVSGKGLPAAMLMAVSHGFLREALSDAADPAAVVARLNASLLEHRLEGRFVTLWLGVLDTTTRRLTYVDAGHGYAFLRAPDGAVTTLREGGGAPVGVVPETRYESRTIEVPAGGKLALVSDGVMEQPGGLEGEQFGEQRVVALVSQADGEELDPAAIIEAVRAHAEAKELADDATAVVVDISASRG